jgi:ParB family chromosome partitioning protein
MTLAALSEIGGPEFSGRYANAKKAELAQNCERIFAGDFIGDADVKDAALAWIPDPMRFAGPLASAVEHSDEVAPDDQSDDPGPADAEAAREPADPTVEEAA